MIERLVTSFKRKLNRLKSTAYKRVTEHSQHNAVLESELSQDILTIMILSHIDDSKAELVELDIVNLLLRVPQEHPKDQSAMYLLFLCLRELSVSDVGFAAVLDAVPPASDGMKLLNEVGEKIRLTSPSRAPIVEQVLSTLNWEQTTERIRQRVKGLNASEKVKGSQKASKHIMVSYPWSHKGVVMEVCSALRENGCEVWRDEEGSAFCPAINRSASTLEGMAAAIEQAAVVVIFVSKQYRDSTNW